MSAATDARAARTRATRTREAREHIARLRPLLEGAAPDDSRRRAVARLLGNALDNLDGACRLAGVQVPGDAPQKGARRG